MVKQYDKYLPIGSIVKIKKYERPLMIVKYNYSKDIDYLGVPHPMGLETEEKIYKFNIEDIEHVYFLGRLTKDIQTDLMINMIKRNKK